MNKAPIENNHIIKEEPFPLELKLIALIIPLGFISIILFGLFYYSNLFPELNSWADQNLLNVVVCLSGIITLLFLIAIAKHKRKNTSVEAEK